jgi:hypothetical protein
MKRALIPLALLSLSSVAASNQPQGGSLKDAKVEHVTIYASGGPGGKGCIVFTLSTNSTGTPSCANGYPRNVAIDLATAGGAMAAAMAQQSTLMGTMLTVTGTGTCIGLSEALASVQTQPMR